MKSYNLQTLRSLLTKVINDSSNPYYSKQGNSLYRDGLVQLRTNFYEPFLNENFGLKFYQVYKKYHNTVVRKNEKHNPSRLENLNLWEKLVIVSNKGIRPLDSEINIEVDIYVVHNKFLNKAVHKNENIDRNTYAMCYWHIQEFVSEILDIEDSAERFQNIEDVIKFIHKGTQTETQAVDLTEIFQLNNSSEFTEPEPKTIPIKTLFKYIGVLAILALGYFLWVSQYKSNLGGKNLESTSPISKSSKTDSIVVHQDKTSLKNTAARPSEQTDEMIQSDSASVSNKYTPDVKLTGQRKSGNTVIVGENSKVSGNVSGGDIIIKK